MEAITKPGTILPFSARLPTAHNEEKANPKEFLSSPWPIPSAGLYLALHAWAQQTMRPRVRTAGRRKRAQ